MSVATDCNPLNMSAQSAYHVVVLDIEQLQHQLAWPNYSFLMHSFLIAKLLAFTKIDSLVLALMTTSLVAMLLGDTNITRTP